MISERVRTPYRGERLPFSSLTHRSNSSIVSSRKTASDLSLAFETAEKTGSA